MQGALAQHVEKIGLVLVLVARAQQLAAGIRTANAGVVTRRNAISAELQRHGRSGVPLYLLYPAAGAGEPEVLPQLLTEGLVLQALSDIHKS